VVKVHRELGPGSNLMKDGVERVVNGLVEETLASWREFARSPMAPKNYSLVSFERTKRSVIPLQTAHRVPQ